MSLISLFRSPDPRERDYLKTIIHRIYGKCMVSRILIRQAISRELMVDSYQENTDSRQTSYGNAEYLEILIAIIDGFGESLKAEHRLIYEQCLLPLHRSPCIGSFRSQLIKAICKFIQKDQSLADQAILIVLKYWPKIDTSKEISSLHELETILDTLRSISPIIEIRHYLVSKVAECASNLHSGVAERALLLLHNPVLLCLINYDKHSLLSILVDSLLQNIYRKDNSVLKLLG